MSTEKATAPFIKLEWELTDSPAFQRLSGMGAKALMVLMRQHNGRNNGEIVAAARWLGEHMGCSHRRAAYAIRELIELGFVRVAVPGGFSTKNRPAVYVLTCFPCGGEPATKDYMSALATSSAEPKCKGAKPAAAVQQGAHEKPIPVQQGALPVQRAAHDSAAGCTPLAYSATGCTIPVQRAAQSIDLPSREPTPSAAAAVSVVPAVGGAGSASAGGGSAGDAHPEGSETALLLAGAFPSAAPPEPYGWGEPEWLEIVGGAEMEERARLAAARRLTFAVVGGNG